MSDRVSGGSNSYYNIPEGAKNCLDIIDVKQMNYSIANIFKACYRFGEKPDVSKEYDLEKIIFFAQRELDKLKKVSHVDNKTSVVEGGYAKRSYDEYDPSKKRIQWGVSDTYIKFDKTD